MSDTTEVFRLDNRVTGFADKEWGDRIIRPVMLDDGTMYVDVELLDPVPWNTGRWHHYPISPEEYNRLEESETLGITEECEFLEGLSCKTVEVG